MKVNINGSEFEYVSDYPQGWKFSAGDPFKFPIQIGDQACFIKRFEQKNPKNISGWELLIELKGKTVPNLSKIYDIQKVQEKGKDIYYIFYEYLEGTTLDKNVRSGAIDLALLSSSLFTAIRSLQHYDFWFADFCEKNIFCLKDGTITLVDVDSTQRTSDLPDNEMYGSKDYWVLVFKFYKEILNKDNLKLSDINGISFNFLQIVFLILRLKLFFQGSRKDYNSTEFYNLLPTRLNAILPEIRQVFLKVLENGKQPISEEDVLQLENLIGEKIIKVEKLKDTPVNVLNMPVIAEFASDRTTIGRGETFTLSWKAENVTKLELNKNGAKFRNLNMSDTSISLTGFADGTQQQSAYQLVAYKDLTVTKSDPIVIQLKSVASPVINDVGKGKKKKWIIGVAALLVAIIVVLLIANPFRSIKKTARLKEKYVRQNVDTAITIYGTGLISKDPPIVRINDTLAQIISVSNDSLLVKLPQTYTTSQSNEAFVSLQIMDKKQNVGTFNLLPPLYVKQKEVYEDSSLVIFGKELNSETIRVFLGDMELNVFGRTGDSIMATVQQLRDTVKGHTMNLSVRENNKVIYSKNWIVTNQLVDLYKLASQARWIGGTLLDDNNSTGNTINLPFPGSQSSSTGFATPLFTSMEDNRFYQVLETHPMWLNRGTIKGFYPWQTMKGKRRFFTSKVGFLNGANSPDGVVFQVWVHYKVNNAERWDQIKVLNKRYSGALEVMEVLIPHYVPDDFYIELRVDAGNNSGRDWAAWVRPMVLTRKLRSTTIKDLFISPHFDLHHVVVQ
jgi:hypothetical protein